MTASTKILLDDIKSAHAMPPEVFEALGLVVSMLTLALTEITDPATRHDYGIVIENMTDELIGPDSSEMPYDFRGQERPATDDDRPLYLRVDDSPVARIVRSCWAKLNMMPLAISDYALALRFLETVVAPFARGFGIPTAEEQAADPDKFPKMGRSAVIEGLLEKARAAKSSDLSNSYKLSL